MTDTATGRGKWGGLGTRVRVAMALMLVSGFFSSLVPLGGSAAAQDVGVLASYVPAESLFYAEFELDNNSDQLEKSAELLERANLAALMTDEQAEEFEMQVGNIGLVANGQAAVFLTDIPDEELGSVTDISGGAVDIGSDPVETMSDEIPAGWGLVVMPADIDMAFAMYSSIAFDEGVVTEESEYGGYTIVTSAPEDEYTTPVFMAQVDDVIVVAAASSDVESVIDTVAGDSPSLSGDETYTMVRESLAPAFIAFGYVNGPAMLDQVEDIEGFEESGLAEELDGSYDVHAGFVFWADDEGFRMDSIAFPAEGAEITEASPYDASFAAETPANALFYAGGTDLGSHPGVNLMAMGFAASIIGVDEDASKLATPGASAEDVADEIFAEAEAELGFNIKTDLLDNLVGEWAMSGTAENLTQDGVDVSALFVTELDDSAEVETVVADLLAMVEQDAGIEVSITTRDVNGSVVTSIDLTSGSDLEIVLEVGVVDDRLMIGINQGLEFASLAESGSLADDEVFLQTFAALPADATSSSYVSFGALIPLVEDGIAMSAGSDLDDDASCAEYATQEEAQAAFDEDPFDNWLLDQNFNDIACEDFFNPPAVGATPDSGIGEINVLSMGTVSFVADTGVGTSTIILIGE